MGLKLVYQGSKSYLTSAQLQKIEQWLIPLERRNISELERHLIEEYDVVFKCPESYYKILRESQLSWQQGNKKIPLFGKPYLFRVVDLLNNDLDWIKFLFFEVK